MGLPRVERWLRPLARTTCGAKRASRPKKLALLAPQLSVCCQRKTPGTLLPSTTMPCHTQPTQSARPAPCPLSFRRDAIPSIAIHASPICHMSQRIRFRVFYYAPRKERPWRAASSVRHGGEWMIKSRVLCGVCGGVISVPIGV